MHFRNLLFTFILGFALFILEPLCSGQAQQAPPAFFEITATYDSTVVNGNQGYRYIQYCAGTAYGPFGDAKCEIQTGGPPRFLPAYRKTSADGGLVFDTSGLGAGTLTANLGIGPSTVSGTLKGDYSWIDAGLGYEVWSVGLNTTIKTFVRGGAGTKFHLDYSVAETSAASLSRADCVGGTISANFGGVAASVGKVGESNANNGSNTSPVGGIDGGTGGESRLYLGSIYTLAHTLPLGFSLNTSTYNQCSPTKFTGQAQTTGDLNLSVRIIQAPHPDPTANINAPPTATLGQPITLDGSASQAYGTGIPIVSYQWTIQGPSRPSTLIGPTVRYTGNQVGAYQLTLKVADNDGQTGTASTTFNVSGVPSLRLSCPAGTGTVNAPYVSALVASGGSSPYSSFGLSSGSLPSGLLLNPSAGTLSGTPSSAGIFSFSAQAQDVTGMIASNNCSITIAPSVPSPLSLSCPAASGTADIPYVSGFNATGGTPPYVSFSLASGTLPPGLLVDASGGILGTPTIAGQFSFSGIAMDSSGATGIANCTITVSGNQCTSGSGLRAVTSATAAQCKCTSKNTPPSAPYALPQNSYVPVFIDPSQFDASEVAQMQTAITNWNVANLLNDAGVSFDPRSSLPPSGYRIQITKPSVYPCNSGKDAACLSGSSLFTIAFDSSISYTSIANVLAHELGHLLGLDDCRTCNDNTTVMNAAQRVNNTVLPTGLDRPSDCDNKVIKRVYDLGVSQP
ncbi:MAG: putative Ig domain-containing protein [Bryobacteraceae bacterium]